jgi:Putative Se/S carrier protein-like
MRVLVVLGSIHDIMAAEAPLLDSGLWFDLIPTPTSISTNCGMVIECRSEDLASVLEVIDASSPGPVRIFMIAPGQAPEEIGRV